MLNLKKGTNLPYFLIINKILNSLDITMYNTLQFTSNGSNQIASWQLAPNCKARERRTSRAVSLLSADPSTVQEVVGESTLQLDQYSIYYNCTRLVERKKRTGKGEGFSVNLYNSISHLYLYLHTRSPYSSFQRDDNDRYIIVISSPISMWYLKQLMEVHS